MKNQNVKRQYFRTQIGDIFEVKISENKKKYFQLIAFDLYQLNSDVIRVFKTTYDLDSLFDINKIINDEVDFYAHCVTKFGLKLNLWIKIAHNMEIGNIENILFCKTEDYGIVKSPNIVKNSLKWRIWKLNDLQSTFIGKLEGENQKANIGIVFNPYDIIDLMNGIKLPKNYPGFDYESEN